MDEEESAAKPASVWRANRITEILIEPEPKESEEDMDDDQPPDEDDAEAPAPAEGELKWPARGRPTFGLLSVLFYIIMSHVNLARFSIIFIVIKKNNINFYNINMVIIYNSSCINTASVAEWVEAYALLGIPQRAVGRGFNPR